MFGKTKEKWTAKELRVQISTIISAGQHSGLSLRDVENVLLETLASVRARKMAMLDLGATPQTYNAHGKPLPR
jgi:hypothetical protein